MKSFEEFEGRVDELLTQVAGPAAGMDMLVRAKGGGRDYEEVWGARDEVGLTAVCWPGAPTRE